MSPIGQRETSSSLIGWLLRPTCISYYDGFCSLDGGGSGHKLWFLRLLVSEVEFEEVILSALPWHSRSTVNKEAQLLPSGHQGFHIALREWLLFHGLPCPHPAQIP